MHTDSRQESPEAVAVVQLAVHQEPLHQVDVFLAGGADAADRAALGGRVGLRGRPRLA